MKGLCVFDLDGTLVDSIEDIAAAVNASLEEMQKPIHPVDAYYKMVGDGMEMLCRRALSGGTEEEVKELVSRYKARYIKNCCNHTKTYPGIETLLSALAEEHAGIAILSNKPQEQTQEVVETLLSDIPFLEVIGQSERFPKKPDPAGLNYLIEKAGVSKEQVWYIGDSDVDMYLGNSVNVNAIGVAWGFRGEKELKDAGAKEVFQTANELQTFLLSHI